MGGGGKPMMSQLSYFMYILEILGLILTTYDIWDDPPSSIITPPHHHCVKHSTTVPKPFPNRMGAKIEQNDGGWIWWVYSYNSNRWHVRNKLVVSRLSTIVWGGAHICFYEFGGRYISGIVQAYQNNDRTRISLLRETSYPFHPTSSFSSHEKW